MKSHCGKRVVILLAAALCAALLLLLVSCFDLGNFEGGDGDYSDYYEAFDGMVGLYDGGKHEYDIEQSLFNDYTVEKADWEDDGDAVASEEYVYLVIRFEREMKIESVGLFLKTPSDDDLSISAFYYESSLTAPSKIKYKSSPDTEIVTETDEEGNEVEKEVEIQYDDPDLSTAVAQASCSLLAGEWDSFLLEKFRQDGYEDDLLHTGKGGLLFIRVENNSGWSVDSEPCTFCFINLLVRAV